MSWAPPPSCQSAGRRRGGPPTPAATRAVPASRPSSETRAQPTAWQSWRRMRVAYLVSRYPAVSHAFLQREVRGLRDSGVDVLTVSVRRAAPEDVLSDVDREEAARTLWLGAAPPAPAGGGPPPPAEA